MFGGAMVALFRDPLNFRHQQTKHRVMPIKKDK